MKKRRKLVLVIAFSLVVLLLVQMFQIMIFINDFASAVYLKDYSRIEHYLGADKVVINGDWVSLYNETQYSEPVSYTLYNNSYLYTKPDIQGFGLNKDLTLQLHFQSWVNDDKPLYLNVRISWFGFNVKIQAYSTDI